MYAMALYCCVVEYIYHHQCSKYETNQCLKLKQDLLLTIQLNIITKARKLS